MKKANIISETLIKLKTGTSYRHTAKIFRTGPTTGRRREIFPEILQSQLQPGQNRIGTEVEYRIHFSGHTQTAITTAQLARLWSAYMKFVTQQRRLKRLCFINLRPDIEFMIG